MDTGSVSARTNGGTETVGFVPPNDEPITVAPTITSPATRRSRTSPVGSAAKNGPTSMGRTSRRRPSRSSPSSAMGRPYGVPPVMPVPPWPYGPTPRQAAASSSGSRASSVCRRPSTSSRHRECSTGIGLEPDSTTRAPGIVHPPASVFHRAVARGCGRASCNRASASAWAVAMDPATRSTFAARGESTRVMPSARRRSWTASRLPVPATA